MSESHKFSVAPMLHCTDRHFRYLARLLSKKCFLYTEMITTGALIYGNRERWLRLHDDENPVAIQLGGSKPNEMAQCAELAEKYKFDEVNINVGCPSDRVQAGKFGACLMLEPEIVSSCIKSMKAASDIEVTVKTRIGVDDQDNYEFLKQFVEKIAAADCKTFVIHARKAHLSGLSPRQNRSIPPLRYEYVYRLKQDFPELTIILNGGIKDTKEILAHLKELDGVMVGREAYDNPYFLSEIDEIIFKTLTKSLSRFAVLDQYKLYMQSELDNGVPLKVLAQHVFGLFNGLPGARSWRRYLSEHIYAKDAGLDVINDAVKAVSEFEQMAIAS
ncbi:MAG: tRNA dihydrouridine(20/20a) synthase DusA [Gammaproteobacteria bacterium]|nr:tRNA dihydrouridine(20/20a) synthase DusA [Gammaproteobacteria bacterium]